MTPRLISIFLALIHVLLPVETTTARPSHPFLGWLGSNTRIVVSGSCSSMENTVALQICRAMGIGSEEIVDDNWILNHKEEAGRVNLIVVGTLTGNEVLVEHPSLWCRSKEQPGGSFRVNGLFFFGIGDVLDSSAGIIEPGRNPYNIELQDKAAHEGLPFREWRWILRLTGRTTAGVASAAETFLSGNMLSGMVATNGQSNGRSPFILSDSFLRSMPPDWARTERPGEISFIGWHQVDALLLSGFASKTGSKPQAAWRLAFRNADSSTSAEASPHRRNTEDEILLCSMTNKRQAEKAARSLMAGIGKVTTEKRKGVLLLRSEKAGGSVVYAAVKDNYLAVESLSAPWDRTLLLSIIDKTQ